jgi:CubicO group peptidase (beta-lactamase class C family)
MNQMIKQNAPVTLMLLLRLFIKDMKPRLLLLLLLFPILLGQQAKAQHHTQIYSVPEDSIRNWLATFHVPAVGIGIIESGRVKSVRVYGDLYRGASAPANTIWNVASLTKPVTALVTLALVSKGLLDLDEPLSKYYIDPDIKDNPWTAELTARILLSHQSGFKNWRFLEPDKKLAFHFEPGKDYKYSGEGLEYLRKALESKFHKTLPQLAAENLFLPLGMKDTRYGWSDTVDSSRFARAQNDKGVIYTGRRTEANAADFLLTTVADYSKFGAYVINGGGLSTDVYRQMTTVQINMDTLAAHKTQGMGLGWEVIRGLPNGEFALTHNGSDPGVSTFILLLPKSKRGIVIFTNGDGGSKVIAHILKASKIDLAPNLATYMGEFR